MKLKLFHKKLKYKLLQGHQVIEAFTHKGVKYFELQDILEIPCQRAFAIRDIFEELQMRCTREFLQAHCTAVNNILINPKSINIPELAKLNMQLQERLDLIIDTEIIYKLSAVYYFTENENPYNFNWKYGYEKIVQWKKNDDKLAFFLLPPVKKLANLSILLEDDLNNYLRVVRKITQKHLADIFTNLSENDKKKDFAQILMSQMQQE